jgi:hypothetical protein
MAQELSEVFWSFLISSCVGLLLAICRLCYKSKCKEVNFGCIKIIRDTQGEEEIDTRQQTIQQNNSEPESPRSERV